VQQSLNHIADVPGRVHLIFFLKTGTVSEPDCYQISTVN